jgi:hypothetical protein
MKLSLPADIPQAFVDQRLRQRCTLPHV